MRTEQILTSLLATECGMLGGMYVMEEHLWTEEDDEQVPGQGTPTDLQQEEETEVSIAIA